jgi:hypothetical protein
MNEMPVWTNERNGGGKKTTPASVESASVVDLDNTLGQSYYKANFKPSRQAQQTQQTQSTCRAPQPVRILKPCTPAQRAQLIKAGLINPKEHDPDAFVGKPIPKSLDAIEILSNHSNTLGSDEFYSGIVTRARNNDGALSEQDTKRLVDWYHHRIQSPVIIENWFANPKHTEFLSDPFIASLRQQFVERHYLSPKQFAILTRWKPKQHFVAPLP